jgi:predicted TIM-barrel fold metal-dependent hydrolase
MWGIDQWDPEKFIAACRPYPGLFPVAGFRPHRPETLEQELGTLREMGFRGIKLHTRFSKFDVADPLLGLTFAAAARHGLVVFWCTFHHTGIEDWPSRDPLAALVEILREAPTAKVILLHGGDVDLLRYMQLVRFNPRLLLDLSHTIAKYPGSSIASDIFFLCSQFDRRICLGTDWPQFSHGQLRQLFVHHTQNLAREKRINIGHRNLMTFLGLEVP